MVFIVCDAKDKILGVFDSEEIAKASIRETYSAFPISINYHSQSDPWLIRCDCPNGDCLTIVRHPILYHVEHL